MYRRGRQFQVQSVLTSNFRRAARRDRLFYDMRCYFLQILPICEFVLRVIKRTIVTNDHNWLITTDSESERSQNER